MMNTNKLFRRCISTFNRTHLRSIPILSHSHSHSSLSPDIPVSRFSPRNVSHHHHNHLPPDRLLQKTFSSETSSSRRCWNCNSPEAFLVCSSCRSVQPLDPSIDFFLIFGLERKYEIEESSLEGKYKDWQKKLHPDLVHSKSEREREYAAEQSARVIDAYRALNNSLSRSIYLMKLQGVHVDEEQTVSDPELLAEIMEIRESVEEAADSEALKQIQTQVQEKMKQWSESFASAFKRQDTDEALNAIRRMTYYKRADEEIVKRL